MRKRMLIFAGVVVAAALSRSQLRSYAPAVGDACVRVSTVVPEKFEPWNGSSSSVAVTGDMSDLSAEGYALPGVVAITGDMSDVSLGGDVSLSEKQSAGDMSDLQGGASNS